MFERFDAQARLVVVLAQEEARSLQHPVIDVEHILLALSRDPTSSELKKFKDLMAEAARDKQTTHHEVLEDLFWAVLTGREFLFNR